MIEVSLALQSAVSCAGGLLKKENGQVYGWSLFHVSFGGLGQF
jgi:hypothetical protein